LLTGGSPAGAQWGWMIGSGVGALTDNTKTYGPRASDAAQQQTQDGTFATYGYGEFVTTGVIMWRAERKEKKHKQGKGGPSNITYSYSWTYAIGICRKGPINGILLVRRNGTIVFDARSNAELAAIGYTEKQIKETRAAQAKWLKKAKFYYGHADQSADPSIQAIKGINNTPRYPGTAYVVLTDEDVTNDGAAIPSYEFVVSACGTKVQAEDGGEILITGSEAEVGGPVFAIAEVADVPTPVAIPTSTGANLPAATATYGDGTWVAATKTGTRYIEGSLSTSATWSTGTLSATNDIEFVEYGGTEWAAKERGATGGTTQAFDGDPSSFVSVSPTTYDTLGNVLTARFQMLRYIDGYWYGSLVRSLHRSTTMAGPFNAVWDEYKSVAAGWDINGASIVGFYDGVQVGDRTYFIVEWHFNVGLQRHRIWWSPDGGVTMSESNIEYDVAYATAGYKPVQLIEVGGKIVALCDDFGVLTNANGTFERVETGMPIFPATGGAQDVDPWRSRRIATDGSRVYIVGGSYMVVSLDKGRTWGDPIALPIMSAKGIAIGNTAAGSDVPDSPGWKYDATRGLNGGTYTTVHPCVTTLDEIVANQCAIRNVSRVVVDELENTVVRGFRVATQTSPKDNIRSLQGSFFFDASDHDGYLHFLMRPQPATFVITQDDMVASEDRALQWEVTKENSILRKVSTTYFDPRANYATTSQDWERKVSVLQAQGEGTFDSALTADATFVKQLCEKSVKVAFAEKDEMTCRVRLNHAARHPGEWGKVQDEDGEFHIARITRVEVEGVTRKITFRKTSRAAYTASALGVNGPLPSFPGSGILGATTSVLMNAPVMVDGNDKPGIAWAAAGMTTGWRGAILQIQRNDWETIGQIDAPCTIGVLSEDLPEFDGTWDTVNTLHVTLDGDIASISFANLLREGNPLAIVRPDGLTEILQHQTAVEVSPGQWELSNLIRARMDTENVAHIAGAKIVVLDTSVKFVQLRKDDIGKTLTFRAVSIGTDPDAAPTQTLTLTTMESQREWQPWNVQVEVTETCEHRVTFVGRHRLGTDLNPVRSQWFKGWRIDFTLRGVTHSRMTQEESFLYTREMQVEDWGVALCASYDVAVYAVNEYTGTDGAGNPPANDNEPFAVTGNLPDGYVGSAYRMFSGDAGFVLTGKSQATYNDAFGLVGSGVTAHGPEPYSVGFVTRGTPLAAGTYVTDINAGSVGIIAQSVDFAAKPTYSLLDMRWRSWAEGRWADTTPPLTTQVYEADQRSGTGSMWTLAALDSSASNTHVEFVITGAPVYIGINANMPAELTDAAFFAGIVYAGANTAAYLASAGTYAIELVPSTGAWQIIRLGTGVVASGTLPLPSGNRYRFGYTVPAPQDSAVRFNGGNEAWLVTATGGFGGMAHPSVVVPVMWLETSPASSVTFGTFGKSSGKWRVQVGGRYRSGLAASGFDEANGLPGDAGADDSIVFDGSTLRWTFGGVASFVDLVWPPSAEPAPVYAIDFAASTVKVCRVDYTTGVVSVIHTISGLPAGTWMPFDFRGYLSKQLKYNPAGPAGYSDWTTTL